MGQLNDIPSIVREHFDKVGSYFKGMAGFFGDPETPGKDANEAITGVDLSGLRRAIQSRVKGSASTTNAALLASFRDLDSMQAELALRNMSRADYYREAASEAGIRQANWTNNMNNNLFNLTGARQAPGSE
jgi:hypothetical protein